VEGVWEEVEVPDLLGTGLGRAKTPQFVKPLITPPLERTSLPAVFAMLWKSVGVVLYGTGEYVLFYFGYRSRPNLKTMIRFDLVGVQ
jgi:hypothetical protein